jgi:hypothetical protein
MTQAKTKALPLPDLGDIFFLCIVQLLLFARPNFLFGDGSTGWHIVVGNYMLEHHVVPHSDILSYTFPGKAWIAYEWLSELTMAVLVKWGGLNLLNVVASAFIALLIVMIYHRCCKTGCHFLLVVVLTLLGAIVSSIHWLARPHIFTFFGVYWFATKLDDFSKGTISGVKLMVCLSLGMLIWVNCHPGFVFGFGILCIYLFCYIMQYILVEALEMKNLYKQRSKWLFLTLLATGSMSLCNPYFLDLYTYTVNYLQRRTIIDVTNEFTSPIFHGNVQPACLVLLFAFLVVGLAITKRPLPFAQLMIALAFGHLSLSAIRNLPLFVIVVLPLISQLFSKTIFSPGQSMFSSLNNRIQAMLESLSGLNASFMETDSRCRLHILPILLVSVLIFASFNGGKVFGQVVIDTTVDQLSLPSKTLMAIKDLKLNPKQGFNLDNWGGCLSYQLGVPVFIDDRTDFYGEPFFFEYDTILNALPGWQDLLKKYGIKWALIPNDSRFGNALEQTLNWKLAVKDDAASLYVETSSKPN